MEQFILNVSCLYIQGLNHTVNGLCNATGIAHIAGHTLHYVSGIVTNVHYVNVSSAASPV